LPCSETPDGAAERVLDRVVAEPGGSDLCVVIDRLDEAVATLLVSTRREPPVFAALGVGGVLRFNGRVLAKGLITPVTAAAASDTGETDSVTSALLAPEAAVRAEVKSRPKLR
jgi:hypothetical protein